MLNSRMFVQVFTCIIYVITCIVVVRAGTGPAIRVGLASHSLTNIYILFYVDYTIIIILCLWLYVFLCICIVYAFIWYILMFMIILCLNHDECICLQAWVGAWAGDGSGKPTYLPTQPRTVTHAFNEGKCGFSKDFLCLLLFLWVISAINNIVVSI